MGFDESRYVEVDEQLGELRNMYWHVRNRGHNQTIKRRYYRLIEKEKLRLVEAGFDQEYIRLVCRYFCNNRNYRKLLDYEKLLKKQLSFDF